MILDSDIEVTPLKLKYLDLKIIIKNNLIYDCKKRKYKKALNLKVLIY